MKTWPALLLVAASLAFVPLPAAADPVIATVNGVDIKQSDLDFAASEVGPRLANYTPADRRKLLLQYVIENELMAGAGQNDNLDKEASFPGRVAYHQRRALRDAFFDAKIHDAVTEADAKKIFDEKIAGLKPEQEVHARHILVETKEAADKVVADLKAGGSFEDLAKQSKDPSGQNGGDLGFFGKGQMVPEFEAAAFALEPGSFTEEPIQSQFGWHVIKLEEKRMSQPPAFDAVKEQLTAFLQRQKFDAILTELRSRYPVEIVGAPAGTPAPDPAAPATTETAPGAPAGEAEQPQN